MVLCRLDTSIYFLHAKYLQKKLLRVLWIFKEIKCLSLKIDLTVILAASYYSIVVFLVWWNSVFRYQFLLFLFFFVPEIKVNVFERKKKFYQPTFKPKSTLSRIYLAVALIKDNCKKKKANLDWVSGSNFQRKVFIWLIVTTTAYLFTLSRADCIKPKNTLFSLLRYYIDS